MNTPESTPQGPLKHRGDELHLLLEVFRAYQALISGFSTHTGMPASRFALLRLLALSPNDMGPAELARHLGVNAAAVTRQLQEMEAERLVKRRSDAKDGRRCYVTLSPEGRRRFQEIHERAHDLERSLSSELGTEQMAAAARTLSNLRTFLEKLKGGAAGPVSQTNAGEDRGESI